GKIRPPKKKKPCSENGQPCDDGDDCTKNDHCVGGVCKGDPISDNTCPVNNLTPIHFRWSEEVHNDGDTSTSIQDAEYDGDVCYDPGAKFWRYQVSSITLDGLIRLSTH